MYDSGAPAGGADQQQGGEAAAREASGKKCGGAADDVVPLATALDGDDSAVTVSALKGPDEGHVGTDEGRYHDGAYGSQQPVVQTVIVVISAAAPLNSSGPSNLTGGSFHGAGINTNSSAASTSAAGPAAAQLEQSMVDIISQMDTSLQSMVDEAFGLLGVQLGAPGKGSMPAAGGGGPPADPEAPALLFLQAAASDGGR
jgi:hypothetical protein